MTGSIAARILVVMFSRQIANGDARNPGTRSRHV